MVRTEWHFGRRPVNVLMIGFAYKGIAFPVIWEVLAKEESSSTEERKELFERFLQLVGPEKIRAFVADREFIGEGWLGFLAEREVPFVIRIRSDRGIALGAPEGPALPVRVFFRGLALGRTRQLDGRRFVGGQFHDVGMLSVECFGETLVYHDAAVLRRYGRFSKTDRKTARKPAIPTSGQSQEIISVVNQPLGQISIRL